MDFFSNLAPPKLQTSIFNISSPLLYVLLALFVAAIILMLLDVKIPWNALNPIPHKYTVMAKAYKYWAPSGVFTNLYLSDAVEVPENKYTTTIECVLYNSRNYRTTDGPYRQIVHRGSDELKTTTVGGFVTGCGAGTSYGDLPPFGLPKRMNPGIFLDPNTNDILIFVDTSKGAESYRESVRIADVPLDIPFYLSVILNGKVLEVYINCKLETTKLLLGEPRNVENKWYGLAGSAMADAQIQNLKVWTFALTSADIAPLCPALPSFSAQRPICTGSDTPVQPSSAKAQANNIDLGFGAALNTCPQ
jgi:hypothetical protein